jgi:hypothetical protein
LPGFSLGVCAWKAYNQAPWFEENVYRCPTLC